MKKIFTLLFFLSPFALSAQDYNPFVSAASIAPAPMVEAASNGSSMFTFTVGNRGTSTLPVLGTQVLKISITLLRGVPNTLGTPPNGVSGPWAQYFSWNWDPFVKTLVGTQIATLPAADSGTITVDYLVTSNSTSASPQNGYNINLSPAPYSAGTNIQNDDNVSAFSYTTAIGLPVDIVKFSGHRVPAGNHLYWTTASELNSQRFDLYYGKDVNNMKKLAEVPSKAENGKSNTSLSYNFVHNIDIEGDSYYRLHSVDLDGKEEIHNTVHLYKSNEGTIAIYPNPASENIFVNYANGELDVVNITLSDMQGRTVYKKKVIIYDNAFNEIVPVKNLAKGTYLLNIKDYEGYEYSQKITKE